MLFSESRRHCESATLPPPLPLMFAVAPATATFVCAIAFEDGRILVGSASANAKLQMGCIWSICLVSLQIKISAVHHSFLSLYSLELCFLLVNN